MISNKYDILNNFLAPDNRYLIFIWELRYRKKKLKIEQFFLIFVIFSIYNIYIEKKRK